MADSNLKGPRRVDGKACLVTGANRGLGRAIAIRLSELGFDVVVNYNSHEDEAEETAAIIRRNGKRALPVKANVAKRLEVEELTRKALDQFGALDVLVNNAGHFMNTPSLELSEEEWDRTVDVHLKGTFLCSQMVGRGMVERRRGSIINMSSVAGYSAFPQRAPYCAAKAGIVALTQVLAIEWAQYNVRVNCIAPAFIETERMRDLAMRGLRDTSKLASRTPMKRLGTPREVADAVAFLASGDSSFVTGETLRVDGGWLAYGYV